MSTETELIEAMDSILPRDRTGAAGCFETDAQTFDMDRGRFVFSTDGFSREDLFLEADPFCLGWNVAVGALSDVLAAGGVPLFYGHAMTITREWDARFIRRFCGGVARALRLAGAAFIGGDLGRSREWKYVASVIGRLEGKPLTRKGACAGQGIYLSGRVGAGNLQAALGLYTREKGCAAVAGRLAAGLCLRLREARLMAKYATSSIDTSDGVFDALGVLSEVNGTGYAIEHLPYVRRGVALTKLLGVHRSLLFFGGCGEYELLFTIGAGRENDFLAEARATGLRFYRLGTITGGSSPARTLRDGDVSMDLSQVRISARDFGSVGEYLCELYRLVAGLVGHSAGGAVT